MQLDIFSQFQVFFIVQIVLFVNCSKTKCGTRTAYFCLSSSWHFLCQADDIFEKSVQQSRFEQMHFKQLTLTPLYL